MKKKLLQLGIKGKVTAVFAAMGIMLVLGSGYATYTHNYKQAATHYTELALSSARMAAALVNGDSVEGYLQKGADSEYYGAHENLKNLKTSYNLTYLYILRPI